MIPVILVALFISMTISVLAIRSAADARRAIGAAPSLKELEMSSGVRCKHGELDQDCAVAGCRYYSVSAVPPSISPVCTSHVWSAPRPSMYCKNASDAEVEALFMSTADRVAAKREGYTVVTQVCATQGCGECRTTRHAGKLNFVGFTWS